MDEDAPGAADPVVVQVADAARRLAAELSRAGSPRDAVAAARDLSASADAALQAAVDRARAAGHARGIVRFDSDGRVAGLAIRPASP